MRTTLWTIYKSFYTEHYDYVILCYTLWLKRFYNLREYTLIGKGLYSIWLLLTTIHLIYYTLFTILCVTVWTFVASPIMLPCIWVVKKGVVLFGVF